MNTITIICVLSALVIGGLCGKFLFSKKTTTQESPTPQNASLSSERVNELEFQLSKARVELESAEKKSKQIKEKYEALLKEANEKVNSLKAQNDKPSDINVDKSDIGKQLAEIEGLKKKIKDLEEENEDLEDDISSCKKKLKSKESDFSTLQTEYNNLLSESKKVKEDLCKVVSELESTTKLLEQKVGSLAFIQEILSAKKADDKSMSHLYATIDNIYDFISGELRDTVCGIFDLQDDVQDYLFNSGLKSWAITQKKSWIQGKTSIAFVGEFSAGKTSIVNRILSQDNPNIPLLPVSMKATTAIPTYISGGISTNYRFVTPSNELKNISEQTFKRVNKDLLDQVNGVSSLIQYFVMTYKNANLDNLSILDTPGFNSNDKEDAERTISVINECDALFWVFDVNAGTVNRTSINLIKEHLTRPLFVVINKVDTKPKSEVDKVESLIKKTLSDAGLSVKGFVRFSSQSPLSDIMSPIKSIGRDSQKEMFLESLLEAVKLWTKNQEKDVISAKKAADSLLSKCNMITDRYNNAIRSMRHDCSEAASVPQYNPQHGFLNFKDPNYDMSIDEYKRMRSLLEEIGGSHVDALCALYNDMKNTSAELENAWNIHSEEREKWQQLNNCLELLVTKTKNLKTK